MKKSLFSLLILSTLSLSTQAIAQQVKLGNTQDITVSGRVIPDNLSCTVQPVSAIQLGNAYVSSLKTTPEKKFSINFSNCNNSNISKKVKVVFVAHKLPYLDNTATGSDKTNVQVGLFDSKGQAVALNGSEGSRTFTSDVITGNNGKLEFALKYLSTIGRLPISTGAFSSTLSFDAYVTDDIQ